MDPRELEFDRIECPGDEGRSLTPEQFVKLDIDERVRIVLSGSLRFTRQGEPMDTIRALAQLRALRVPN